MVKVKAYKVQDFSNQPTDSSENRPQEQQNITSQLKLLAGIIDDFEAVSGALKAFPYKSMLSLLGVIALVFVTFKVGTKFGMIQSRFKRKGT